MADRYIPLQLKHAPAPKVRDFAILTGVEAGVRGMLVSAMPLAVYEVLGSAESTSAAYFMAGVLSLIWGLMVPWATRKVPRRWMYTVGCGLYLVAMTLAVIGTPLTMALALVGAAMATATTFVCMNAYILDYIDRANLGRNQSMQMVFSAVPWAVGPVLGVWLRGLWAPLPFLVASGFAVVLLAVFWTLRLGNGKQIARAKKPPANPLAYLGRFFQQPRLIAGWLFAVTRSCGWWVYIVYLPIYCVENGLGDKVGGMALSASNGLLFLSPLMLRYARRASVRTSVRFAFLVSAVMFAGAAFASPIPWATVGFCLAASTMMVLLDVVGGLPFLMSVKPSERTEMSAVYSSYRDVSGILTPGVAWLVLLVAPLPAIFLAASAGLIGSFVVAGKLPSRLGVVRPSRGGAV